MIRQQERHLVCKKKPRCSRSIPNVLFWSLSLDGKEGQTSSAKT